MITLISIILVLVGALNWLCVGLFGFNLVEWICMNNMIAARVIYSIVGIAAIWLTYDLIAHKGKLHATIHSVE